MNEDPNKQNAFNLNESVSGQPIFGAPQNNGFSTPTTPITSADTGLSATPTIPNASAAPTTPNASVAPVVSIAPVAPTTSVNPAASITSANTASPATPIMSTPEANAPQAAAPNAQDFTPNTQFASRSASKFFGGRRRASRIAADANLSNPSQYNNQNAPAFFNQAMQQNNMAAAAVERKNNKRTKIFISSIASILTIAVLIGVGAIFIQGNVNEKEKQKLSELKEVISDIRAPISFLSSIDEGVENSSISMRPYIDSSERDEKIKELDDAIDKINSFIDISDEYSEIKISDGDSDVGNYVSDLKKSLVDRLPLYQKYKDILAIAYNIESDGMKDEYLESLTKLSDSDHATVLINTYNSYLLSRTALASTWTDNDCNKNYELAVCKSLTDTIMRSEVELENSKALATLMQSVRTNSESERPDVFVAQIINVNSEEE